MGRLTRKVNGEWDWNSLIGESRGGIVCHRCGKIVPLAYYDEGFGERYGYANYMYCPNCFRGGKEIALTCKVGH